MRHPKEWYGTVEENRIKLKSTCREYFDALEKGVLGGKQLAMVLENIEAYAKNLRILSK